MEQKEIEKQARLYRLLNKIARQIGHKSVEALVQDASHRAVNADMAAESEAYRRLLRKAQLSGWINPFQALEHAENSALDAGRYKVLQSAINVSWTFMLVDDSLAAAGVHHVAVYSGNMGTPEWMDEILDAIARGEIPDND